MAALEPRVEPCVYVRDGFVVTLWTYYEPVPPRAVAPAEYAHALDRLHAGMRQIDVTTPHFTDRVAQAQWLVGSRDHTPALADADRELLSNTLRSLRRRIAGRGAAEQLLHGEPHPGNLLRTKNGLLFADLETCCRGPVEFDIAHVPEEVSEHYPDINQELLRECRILMLAMGGTIGYQLEPAGGTTFTITLPVATAGADAEEQPERAGEASLEVPRLPG